MEDIKGGGGRPPANAGARKCSACGRALDPDAAFCTSCGRRLEKTEPQGREVVPLEVQLLALANDLLSVKETAPARFEFSSQTGAQGPGRKVSVKYDAVALLEPEKKRLTFWDRMIETSAGAEAGFSSEKKTQRRAAVSQQAQGTLLSGGKYGFEYGKLRRVVKEIAVSSGWAFQAVTFRPAAAKPRAADQVQGEAQAVPCGRCGASLHRGTDFCTRCGARAPEPEKTSDRGAPKEWNWLPLILAGAALLVAAALLLFVTGKKEGAVAIPGAAGAVDQKSGKGEASGQGGDTAESRPVADRSPAASFNEQGIKMARANKMEAAVSWFEKAVQTDASYAHAWNNLGLALRRLGRNEEAVSAYRRAIREKPDFALPYKNLGVVLEQMGLTKEAAKAYKKYMGLNPNAADRQAVKKKADMLANAGHGEDSAR